MVKDKCDGSNFCELEASNEVFGNPCGITHKYLEVNFHCQAGKIVGGIWEYFRIPKMKKSIFIVKLIKGYFRTV